MESAEAKRPKVFFQLNADSHHPLPMTESLLHKGMKKQAVQSLKKKYLHSKKTEMNFFQPSYSVVPKGA